MIASDSSGDREPFKLTHDPRFFYTSPEQLETYARLLSGIHAREGLFLMVGDSGTGKTALLRRMQDDLNASGYGTFFLCNPFRSFDELVSLVCEQAGLAKATGVIWNSARFSSFIASQVNHPVLLVDEADALSNPMLESVCKCAMQPDRSGLQVVLAGQALLEVKLRGLELGASIARSVQLRPLLSREVRPFINHQLRVAGHTNDQLFTLEAIDRIAEYSKGLPGRINALCGNAMLIAEVESLTSISDKTIDQVYKEQTLGETLSLTPGEKLWSDDAGPSAGLPGDMFEELAKSAPVGGPAVIPSAQALQSPPASEVGGIIEDLFSNQQNPPDVRVGDGIVAHAENEETAPGSLISGPWQRQTAGPSPARERAAGQGEHAVRRASQSDATERATRARHVANGQKPGGPQAHQPQTGNGMPPPTARRQPEAPPRQHGPGSARIEDPAADMPRANVRGAGKAPPGGQPQAGARPDGRSFTPPPRRRDRAPPHMQFEPVIERGYERDGGRRKTPYEGSFADFDDDLAGTRRGDLAGMEGLFHDVDMGPRDHPRAGYRSERVGIGRVIMFCLLFLGVLGIGGGIVFLAENGGADSIGRSISATIQRLFGTPGPLQRAPNDISVARNDGSDGGQAAASVRQAAAPVAAEVREATQAAVESLPRERPPAGVETVPEARPVRDEPVAAVRAEAATTAPSGASERDAGQSKDKAVNAAALAESSSEQRTAAPSPDSVAEGSSIALPKEEKRPSDVQAAVAATVDRSTVPADTAGTTAPARTAAPRAEPAIPRAVSPAESASATAPPAPAADAASKVTVTPGRSVGAEDTRLAVKFDLGEIPAKARAEVSGLPAGSELSAGRRRGDRWIVDSTALDSLFFTPPRNQGANITADVTLLDANGERVKSVKHNITVEPVADPPVILVAAANGDQYTAIPLEIEANLSDRDGSESLSIAVKGVPGSVELSAGRRAADGVWLLTKEDLPELILTPGAGSPRVLNLTIAAVAEETANGHTTATETQIRINVIPSDPPR